MLQSEKRRELKQRVLALNNDSDFEQTALEVFYYQYAGNEVYRRFCDYLRRQPSDIQNVTDIPFIPVEFFKNHRVITGPYEAEVVFRSSGTTGMHRSRHYVADAGWYRKVFTLGFEAFYGPLRHWRILALLPSYLEQGESSLVFMAEALMKQTPFAPEFFLHDLEGLEKAVTQTPAGQKVMLLGVSYALADLAERGKAHHPRLTVVETGGMKGRRKELIRSELHNILKKGLGVDTIHSEYGMTELLSQAWSQGGGLFGESPSMRVVIRDPNDPLSFMPAGRAGGINIIDLGNIDSCSFIATQDLGKKHNDGSFEVLGRFDHSDVRGCNLMAEG